MAFSFRTIQAALNGAGFSRSEVMGVLDSQVFALQNVLAGATANVNNSAVLVDALVSGRTDTILGTCLQVELEENINITESNLWYIEAHIPINTAATQGIKMQLTAYDGLVFDTSTDQAPFVNFTFNVNTTAGAAIAGAVTVAPGSPASFQSASGNAISADINGVVRVKGHGRIGVQFAQSVATVANTSLTGGYIVAYTILP